MKKYGDERNCVVVGSDCIGRGCSKIRTEDRVAWIIGLGTVVSLVNLQGKAQHLGDGYYYANNRIFQR